MLQHGSLETIIDQMFELLTEKGNERGYGDEPVSQLEHALQTAWLAEQDGAPASLITASLLHDVGHLMDHNASRALERSYDAEHETLAADYLCDYFPAAVTAPIRWHVAAKRYLTTVDATYLDRLSPGSMRSLELQGGPFSKEEAQAFLALPHTGSSVQLRRWDDMAKNPDAEVPDIEHFRMYVQLCLHPVSAA